MWDCSAKCAKCTNLGSVRRLRAVQQSRSMFVRNVKESSEKGVMKTRTVTRTVIMTVTFSVKCV